MEFVSKGGYAEVYYDAVNSNIFRRLPRTLKNSRQMDATSFNDLIFTKTLEYTNCTPIVHSEDISKDYISFRMPHYGVTLHRWARANSPATRLRNAAHIMAQLIIGCIYLEQNAVFHSDIKPLNIMIETLEDGDLVVRIIDFNIASVKVISCGGHDIDLQWSKTIGTWSYTAPEITLYETPYNNSISWAIGLVAAFVIDTYPFVDVVPLDIEQNMDQDVWCRKMSELHEMYPDHPPLLRSSWYGEKWQRLIHCCTEWSSGLRWSLSDIYSYLYSEIMTSDDRAKRGVLAPVDLQMVAVPIRHQICVVECPFVNRCETISTMYSVCSSIKNMNLFPTAVAIYDRYTAAVGKQDAILVTGANYTGAACIILASFLNGCSLLGSRSQMTILMNSFSCTNKPNITAHICYVGGTLRWKLWEKPCHIYAAERDYRVRNHPGLYQCIRDILVSQTSVYTQEEVGNIVLDRLMLGPDMEIT